MSSFTQDDDGQISDVLLSIWACGEVGSRGAKGNKERWYGGFCVNGYNIWNSTKAFLRLTRSCGHRITQCRGEILPEC